MRLTYYTVAPLLVAVTIGVGVDAHETRRGDNVHSECSAASEILQLTLKNENEGTDLLSAKRPTLPSLPRVTSTGKVEFVRRDSLEPFWGTGWKGHAPSQELLRKWFGVDHQPITNCFPTTIGPVTTLSALLGHWPYHETQEERRVTPGTVTVEVTMPVLDASKQISLIYYTRKEQGVGGKGELVLLRKMRQGWQIIGRRLVYVS